MDANMTVIERHLALVEGIEVECLVAGDGPEVVLLHGLGDSAEDWREVMARLAPSYRLYAPTLPGFGGDLGADGDGRRAGGFDPSPDGYARFVHAFVAAKDLRRPVLAGHSIGGLVALRAALNQPDGLRGLVLAAAAGLGRAVNPLLQAYALPGFGDVAASVARTAPGAALRAVSKVPMVFGRPWRVRHAWLLDQFRRAQDGRFMETTMRALRGQVGIRGQRRVVLDELPELSLPTLVLWGDSDRVVPLAQGYAAVARLPVGRLEVLGGAGHLAHVEDPDRAAAAMRRFLDELH